MLERLVENWLTSVGELGYQAPFAQLLIAEGHWMLQGPVHHPNEHGKDIITLNQQNELCAFQLKGPKEISDLKGLEKYQGQIDALALTAISHPGLGGDRLADRVYIVTNGELRPEVRDRLKQISIANRLRKLPPLEYVERDHLVTRFLAAHGKYLPSDPPAFRQLVDLYSQDGTGPLPTFELLAFIEGLLPYNTPSATEAHRALTSAALFTAYSLRGWQASGNHLGIAQGWLLYCVAALRYAETLRLADSFWKPMYDLALQAARSALRGLLDEASARENLVEPDLADGAFYGTRALLVLGWTSAYFLSERILGADDDIRRTLQGLLRREFRFSRLLGESGAPLLFVIANALSIIESTLIGEQIVIAYTRNLLQRNQPSANNPLPDPYHSVEDTLAYSLGIEVDGIDPHERFDGHSYTAVAAIEWLVRRLRRQAVKSLWYSYTHVSTSEFIPSTPALWLAASDGSGTLDMRIPKAPGSWSNLRTQSLSIDRSIFPELVWRHMEMLPYLLLLLPQRFTSASVRLMDSIWFPSGDYLDTSPVEGLSCAGSSGPSSARQRTPSRSSAPEPGKAVGSTKSRKTRGTTTRRRRKGDAQ